MKLQQSLFRAAHRILLLCGALAGFAGQTAAQTVTPASINVQASSPIHGGGSQNFPLQICLPPGSTVTNVDVFLLLDDTGSFASFSATVQSIFSNLVTSLETALPGVVFGFGVGRFEDYGGPGESFSNEDTEGRPFILNQPVVTAATAGGAAARNALITAALGREAPGFGGDGAETAIEALYQIATGLGFDGNGNGSAADSGTAGNPTTQTSPGASGDVPAFSSNVALTSGNLGGVGFRTGALHLVLLATDIGTVTAFPVGNPIPATVSNASGLTVPTSAFDNFERFGFVSNSVSTTGNTVAGAVVPTGGATLQAAISALNALGVRVIGMGPGAAPTTSVGPSSNEAVFLSALARLTGAVNAASTPLVFSTSVSVATLTSSIVAAITTTTTLPVDITVVPTTLPAGLTALFAPTVVNGVAPGGCADFIMTLQGGGGTISGAFDLRFQTVGSGSVLGLIPVTISSGTPPTTTCTAVVVASGKILTLRATDDTDPNPSIFIKDSASTFIAGPFTNAEQVHVRVVPAGTPFQTRLMGAISARVQLKGTPLVFATDSSGASSTPIPCP